MSIIPAPGDTIHADSTSLRVVSMAGAFSLQVINLAEARYDCTYGRGCDGLCCREGRPLVYPEEIERTDANLPKFWPLLRPEARKAIEKRGYLTKRRRLGQRVMRAAGGWCVFFQSRLRFAQSGRRGM